MTETTGRKRARRPTQRFVNEESEQDGDVSAGSAMVGGFGTVPGEAESEGSAKRRKKNGAQKADDGWVFSVQCRADEDEVAAAAQPAREAREAREAKTPFLCSEDGCFSRFSRNANLLRHLQEQHPLAAEAVQAARAAREANKPFLCLVDGCDKRYTTNENLLEHRKRKHDVTEKAREKRERQRNPSCARRAGAFQDFQPKKIYGNTEGTSIR